MIISLCSVEHVFSGKFAENDLSRSISDFTVGLTRHHSSNYVAGRRDLVWSPLSIYQAMLMVGEGADGLTFSELQRLTHLKERETYRQWSSTMFDHVQSMLDEVRKSNVSFNLVNQLYADEEFDLDEEFNKNLEKFYRSKLELIDFNDADAAADRINKWIGEQTNEMIKNLLKPKDIDPTTRLMLINAFHFKAPWLKPFDRDLTTKENFTLSTDRTIELSMMHQTSHFSYYYDKKHRSQWINLPYKGNRRFVLTLALPDEGVELRQLEKKILRNSKVLKTIFNNLDNRTNSHRRVELILPKFRIESSFDFVPIAKDFFNVKSAFDSEKADFSLMSASRNRDLFVSKIIHKALIDVDEAGSEAAAVTVVQMLSRSGMFLHENPIRLVFSRAFLFYLRDLSVNVPLFVGRFTGISMSN